MQPNNFKLIRRNLWLLALGRGMMFWYAIEKLYELHIGLALQQIVIMGVIAQGSKFIFELPTSIVADRWNRRNILIGADIMMVICCLVLGTAHSFNIYIIGTLCWAISDALSGGVYEAFAYDSLATQDLKDKFKAVYTRMTSIELAGLAIFGVIAGIIGRYLNLQLDFFLTILPMLASIWLLLGMVDPEIKRTGNGKASWLSHLSSSFKSLGALDLRWVSIVYVSLIGFICIWYEYFQLIGISVKVPTAWFGFLIAVLTLGMTVGAELAHALSGSRVILRTVWLILLVAFLLGLRNGNMFVALLDLFVASIALRMLEIYLELYFHEHISSDKRATILSLATTLGYGMFGLLAVAFWFLIHHLGPRTTFTYVSLPLLVIGVADMLKDRWSTEKANRTTTRSFKEVS